MTRQILLEQDNGYFVAKDISSGVVSQGKSVEEAKANLLEALELYFEDDAEPISSTSGYFLETLEVSA